ncbi:MAG: T9SS type A sorting domain-containing protein [Chitinophagaceae bacterium]|nr:T9SS type A sorting domain-containing protein [Chitinophagaceae bacterium]
MLRLYLLGMFLCLYGNIFSQKNLSKNWILGAGISYKVKFENQVPEISYFNTTYNYYFIHGSSCISDSNGYLKILCNGYQIYDTLGAHIENGDSLVPPMIYDLYDGFSGFSQSSLILPFSDDIYYILTPTASDLEFISSWGPGGNAYFDLLLCHKVDMKLGSNGRVIKKAMPLLQQANLSKSQMMACRHADGINWWLLKPARSVNTIYKFIVTKDSVYNMGSQVFMNPQIGIPDIAGQCMFNQLGTQFASVVQASDFIFIADFDRCSGELTNSKFYKIPDHIKLPTGPDLDTEPSGICFSPNGQFLYISKYYNIYQFDLLDPDTNTAWYHVANLDTSAQAFQGYGNIYLGPDDKAYIANWNGTSKQMSKIESPDVKGAGCNFCPRCFRFPQWGPENPPNMPNYALGKDTTINCNGVGFDEGEKENERVTIFPNPSALGMFNVECSMFQKRDLELEVYTLLGQKVLSQVVKRGTLRAEVDVRGLGAGVYFLKARLCSPQAGETWVRKVVVE